MSDELSVVLTDAKELAAMIKGRKHWVFAFGRKHVWAIDSLDDAIAVYPTCPTVMFPVTMTLVPKAVFTREQIQKWLKDVGNLTIEIGDEQDLFLVTNDADEGYAMASQIVGMAQ
jgi:hypothetical protein